MKDFVADFWTDGWGGKVVICLIGVAVLAVCLWITDYASGSSDTIIASVLDKHYEPSRWQTETSSDSKGRVTTSQYYYPERWIVLVRIDNDAKSVDAKSSIWASVKAGDRVSVWVTRGGIFGGQYIDGIGGKEAADF